MARPKNLQTKGYFSVMDSGHGDYNLVFKGKFIVLKSKRRSYLYHKRSEYSSWLYRIKALLESTKTELKEIV